MRMSDIKNILIKVENWLVDELSNPRGIPPKSSWNYFRLIKILLFIFIITIIPVVGLTAYLFSMFGFKSSQFLHTVDYLVYIGFALLAYLGSEINFFRCPRCNKYFFHKSLWEIYYERGKCAHCGLFKWEEPDNQEPPPDSKSGKKPTRLLRIDSLIRIGSRVAAVFWTILIVFWIFC